MTVRETIANLRAKNLENRLDKLTAMGAPMIMIKQTAELLNDAKNSNIKVNGLERKHKVADETVTELYQEDAIGNYYKEGRKATVVLKLITTAGTYYYDYFSNKIGKIQEELDVNIAEDKFQRVF